MRIRAMMSVLLLTLFWAALPTFAQAEDDKAPTIEARAIEVGAGPLLMFAQPEESQKPGDFDRAVYLFNPLHPGQPPQLAFRGLGSIGPAARIDSARLVLSHDYRLWLTDLNQGTVRPISTDRCTFFAGLEGSKLYFQEDPRHPKDRLDPDKKTDPDWYRLYVLDTRGDQAPRLLWDKRYSELLTGLRDGGHHPESGWFSTREHFWVMVTKPPSIWKIAKNGNDHQKVIRFDKLPAFQFSTNAALSPNGRYLALEASSARAKDVIFRGNLVVFDVRTGKPVYMLKDISIEISSLSSDWPWLHFCWLDDHRIRFSETKITKRDEKNHFHLGYFQWVDVDIHTQKRLQEKAYTQSLGVNHIMPSKDSLEPPDPSRRERVGQFDLIKGNLYYRDAKKPIRPPPNQDEFVFVNRPDFRISPDGRWAAFYDPIDECVYLVDGKKKEEKKIADGFGHRLEWLRSVQQEG